MEAVTVTHEHPYAHAAGVYWEQGWRSILPLPLGKKALPPTGYTGRRAIEPSWPDVQTWIDNQPSNLALRLPPGVVGIDVDDYEGKSGGATLAGLVEQYGELPATWMSTSRGDGISGIRLYAIPEGVETITALENIELIQPHHRYVVAWPSIHPNGNQYQWIDEATGRRMEQAPPRHQLPELPQAWVEGLRADTGPAKTNVSPQQVTQALEAMPAGEGAKPCRHITEAQGRVMTPGSRHEAMNDAVLTVIGAGRRGCPGAPQALDAIRAHFTVAVTADNTRSHSEADAEFYRSVEGAVAIVATDPQGAMCPDRAEKWVESLPEQRMKSVVDLTDTVDGTGDGGDFDDPPASPSEAIERQARLLLPQLLIREKTRELLREHQSAAAKPLIPIGMTQFLQQPDEPVNYRLDGLWPVGGRVLLAAAAKAGKTTIVTGNLLPALVDGEAFLGQFQATPVTGSVVLLNMEVGDNTIRQWLRASSITNTDRIHILNLRGQASALTLATEPGRKRVAQQLRDLGAEVVILDPLAPLLASLDIDENSNADVARFFSYWSETMQSAGVKDDLIVHHTGHEGKRSRGATRLMDEPDAVWNLTRDQEEELDDDEVSSVFGAAPVRYFAAYGRDVEVGKSPLAFDADTRRLRLTTESREQARKSAKSDAASRRVLDYVASNPGCSRTDVVESGGRQAANREALRGLISMGRILEEADESVSPTRFVHYISGVNTPNVGKNFDNPSSQNTPANKPIVPSSGHRPKQRDDRPTPIVPGDVTLAVASRNPGTVGRSGHRESEETEKTPGRYENNQNPTTCAICGYELHQTLIAAGLDAHRTCQAEQDEAKDPDRELTAAEIAHQLGGTIDTEPPAPLERYEDDPFGGDWQ